MTNRLYDKQAIAKYLSSANLSKVHRETAISLHNLRKMKAGEEVRGDAQRAMCEYLEKMGL